MITKRPHRRRTDAALRAARRIDLPRVREGEILLTDAASAEMAKLVENAYRDVNIAFANEWSLICESLHVDVWEVIRLANRHHGSASSARTRRRRSLHPGRSLVHRGGRAGAFAADPHRARGQRPSPASRGRTGHREGDALPHAVDRVSGAHLQGERRRYRESPAIEVVGLIAAALPDVEISACDPFVSAMPPLLAGYGNLRLQNAYQAVEQADIVVLLVEHEQFKAMRQRG